MWFVSLSSSSRMILSTLPGPLSMYSFSFSICAISVSERNCLMSPSTSLTGINLPSVSLDYLGSSSVICGSVLMMISCSFVREYKYML